MRPVVLLSFVVFVVALSASGQPFRTYVSGNGSDANSCAVTSPCRSLGQAISVVAPGGEVISLDSAGLGQNLTITQAVSILIPDGIYGAITTASGDAITVSAGSTDTVRIKGLNIVANGTTGSGIVVQSAGRVYIDDVTISGFLSAGGSYGILVSGDTDAFVTNSRIRVQVGIAIQPSSAGHKSVITNCTIENPNFGIGVMSLAYGNVTVRDTVVSHALGSGAFYADSTIGGVTPELTLDHCLASYSYAGVFANTGSLVRMTGCTLIDNTYGIYNSGTLYSWSDNVVHGSSTANVTGTISNVTKH